MTPNINVAFILFLLGRLVLAVFKPDLVDITVEGITGEIVYFEDSPSVVFIETRSNSIKYSANFGKKWDTIKLVPKDLLAVLKKLIKNPYNSRELLVLTDQKVLYRSTSQGADWKHYEIPEQLPLEEPTNILLNNLNDTFPVTFSPGKDVILAGNCAGLSETCDRQFYHIHNFKTTEKLLVAKNCIFRAKKPFCLTQQGSIVSLEEDELEKPVIEPENGPFQHLYYYHELFVAMDTGNIYLSTNGLTWASARLPDVGTSLHLIASSYANSLVLSVKSKEQVGKMYKVTLNVAKNNVSIDQSLEYVHRNMHGLIDYETIDFVSGIMFANELAEKELRTRISTDNGNLWDSLNVADSQADLLVKEKQLNLHLLIRKASNDNHVKKKYRSMFSSNVLAGVGNVGSFLQSYNEGDTWISLNNGFNWTKTLDGPHLFQFVGSLLIAIKDSEPVETIKYSLDYGRRWHETPFSKNKILDIIASSMSTQVLLVSPLAITSVDFGSVYEDLKSCEPKDYDTVYISDRYGEPYCYSGFKQTFQRRKADRRCRSHEHKPEIERCECAQADYECAADYFADSDGNCVTNKTQLLPDYLAHKYCDGETESYSKPSGYLVKDGNRCFADKHMGLKLDQAVETPCQNYKGDNDNEYKDKNRKEKLGKMFQADRMDHGKVATSWNVTFDGLVLKYDYLLGAKNKKGYEDDEVVVLITSENRAYISFNHGVSWQQIALEEDTVVDYHVDVANGRISVVSASGKVYYSHNNGYNWHSYHSPVQIASGANNIHIEYNQEKRNWIIFTAKVESRRISYISTDLGSTWSVLQDNVMLNCLFATNYLPFNSHVQNELIYCPRFQPNGAARLLASRDFFSTLELVLADLVSLWVDHRNVFVGVTGKTDEAVIYLSYDGENWKNSSLPHRLSLKNSLFMMFDLKNDMYGSIRRDVQFFVMNDHVSSLQFGDIYKSDGQGDKFVLMQSNVDFSSHKVDFETAYKLHGIVITNQVVNARLFSADHRSKNKASHKILQSKITFDDGSHWRYLEPPEKDANGNPYRCARKSRKECALHLYGMASGKKNKLSSQSAVGMFIGVGTVGDSLGKYDESSTFLTTDAGLTWKEIKTGPCQYEFGDQGSIIVLVDDRNPTDSVHYSVDNGATWQDYRFSPQPVRIYHLTTVQTDSSRSFLLFSAANNTTKLYTVNFDKLLARKCRFDPYIGLSDFETWSPVHPGSESHKNILGKKCFLGKELEFYRKKPDSVCHIGNSIPQDNGKKLLDCPCTRYDFECDINYESVAGKCQIIPELKSSIEHQYSAFCGEMPDVVEYLYPSGFRRISASTCSGGIELDRPIAKPCPGKKKEFDDKYSGVRGFKLLLIVLIILIGLSVVCYMGSKAFYMNSHGQIHLADASDDFDRFYLTPNNIPITKIAKHRLFALCNKIVWVGRELYEMVRDLIRESNSRMDTLQYRRVFQNGFDEDHQFAISDPDELNPFRDRSD